MAKRLAAVETELLAEEAEQRAMRMEAQAAKEAAKEAAAAAMEAALLEEEAALTAKEVAKLEVTAEAEAPPAAPAAPTPTVPTHSVHVAGSDGARTLTLLIELPGVRGMGEMSVELAEREIVLSGGGYSLRESLPFAVDSSRATAKFAKKTSTLKMSAPEM